MSEIRGPCLHIGDCPGKDPAHYGNCKHMTDCRLDCDYCGHEAEIAEKDSQIAKRDEALREARVAMQNHTCWWEEHGDGSCLPCGSISKIDSILAGGEGKS